MSECDALLRAVCDNPDDDTPRLVLADWLDEHGEPERAEFIRVQVKVADLYRFADPAADETHRRARDLWMAQGDSWRDDLPQIEGVTWPDSFHRGFPERVTVETCTTLVQNADAILATQPIRHLTINRFRCTRGFNDLPELSRLKTLTLINPRADRKILEGFMQCRHLNNRVMLSLEFGSAGQEMYAELRAAFGKRLFRPYSPPPSRPGQMTR